MKPVWMLTEQFDGKESYWTLHTDLPGPLSEVEARALADSLTKLYDAAPDMLEALKSAERALNAAVAANVDVPGFDPGEHAVVKEIRSAIARAEGREP